MTNKKIVCLGGKNQGIRLNTVPPVQKSTILYENGAVKIKKNLNACSKELRLSGKVSIKFYVPVSVQKS